MSKFNELKQKILENHKIIAIFIASAVIFYFIYDFYDWLLWLVLAVILYETITFRVNIAKWQAICKLKKKQRRANLGKVNQI